jgi:hypothetical protein
MRHPRNNVIKHTARATVSVMRGGNLFKWEFFK